MSGVAEFVHLVADMDSVPVAVDMDSVLAAVDMDFVLVVVDMDFVPAVELVVFVAVVEVQAMTWCSMHFVMVVEVVQLPLLLVEAEEAAQAYYYAAVHHWSLEAIAMAATQLVLVQGMVELSFLVMLEEHWW